MTDNEIIKALECCYLYDVMFCDKCPNKDTCGEIDVAESAIDLINRQKAEIERLTDTLKATIAGQETLQRYIATAKAEAIKEFAERLKFNVTGIPWCEYGPVHREVDKLVKEMVGDAE